MQRVILGLTVVCAVAFNANIVKGADGMIETGKTVKFNYTLTVKGQTVDSSEGKEPLEYVQGEGKIIKGLETQMEGLKAGDKKAITVGSEDAYGIVDQRAIVEIPKNQLGEEVTPQPGMMLQLTTADGKPLAGMISEVKDAVVVVDFNHPLAGKELLFDIEVVEVK